MKKYKKLPDDVAVAVSGGVDSMVLLNFLRKKHNITVLHYVHDSSVQAQQEHAFVSEQCSTLNLPLIVQKFEGTKPSGKSNEHHWRDCRYEFFKEYNGIVCTGHTADDLVEWYLFSCMRGMGQYMEYSNKNVVRPFITTRKEELIRYAKENNIKWIEDPTNADVTFAKRNSVRHELLPMALRVNPGLYNTVMRNFRKKNDTK